MRFGFARVRTKGFGLARVVLLYCLILVFNRFSTEDVVFPWSRKKYIPSRKKKVNIINEIKLPSDALEGPIFLTRP